MDKEQPVKGEDKKVLRLLSKEKPPAEKPGETPDDLMKKNMGEYEDLILIGWKGDYFKISWSESLSPEDVNAYLDITKQRLLASLFSF